MFSVIPGNYTLKFVAPENYTFTRQNVSTNDTIDSDANVTGWTTDRISLQYITEHNYTWDAGLYRYASIGDFVWLDCNVSGYYNGIQDTGEPGVPGVNVSLYNSSDDSEVSNTTTNDTGYYNFTNLNPGVYYLVFALPGGYKWTLQDQGNNDTIDSDVNPSTSRTINFTLDSGEIDLTWDAGLASDPCLPIPEMDTVVLFSAGLLTLAGYVVVRRRRRRD